MSIEQDEIKYLAFECCKCKGKINLQGVRLKFLGTDSIQNIKYAALLDELGIKKV